MNPYRSRIPAWKVLCLFGGAALVTLLALVIWIKTSEVRKWGQMKQRMGEIRAGWGRCGAGLRIPRGQPVDGDAWPDYSSALACASEMTQDETSVLRTFVLTESRNDLEAVRKIVDARAKALESLAEGARKAQINAWGRPPLRSDGVTPDTCLALLSVARSRLLALDGKPRQAAQPLLDFSRMMLDFVLLNSNTGSAWLELAIPLYDIKLLSTSARMTPDELGSLEMELGQLDDGFPCHALQVPRILLDAGEFLESSSSLKSLTLEKESLFSKTGYALFSKLMKANAFLTLDQAAHEVLRVHEGDYPEVRRVYDDTWDAAMGSRNLIVRRLPLVNRWIDGAARERHTQIRLARCAARYRATGEILNLRDPWGTTLHHELTYEGWMKFWSAHQGETYMNPRPGGWKPKEWSQDDPYYPFRVEVRR